MNTTQVSQMTSQQLHDAADRIALRIVGCVPFMSDAMIVVELSNRLRRAEGSQARREQRALREEQSHNDAMEAAYGSHGQG